MLIWILNIFAAYFLDFCARPELRLFSLSQEGSDRGQARPQLSLGPLTTGRNKIKYTTKGGGQVEAKLGLNSACLVLSLKVKI